MTQRLSSYTQVQVEVLEMAERAGRADCGRSLPQKGVLWVEMEFI